MIEKTRWGIVFLLICTGIIAAFQVGKAAISVPDLRGDLGISLVFASWIVGALGALGAIVGVPAGLLLSLFPPRRMLITGLTAIGIGSLAGSMMDSGPLLLATRVIEGFGFICTILSAPRLFAFVTVPKDAPLAFAYWGSYMPAGSAIMMLAGPAFIAAFGWQGLWFFNGILPLAYAILIARLDIPGADTAQKSDRTLLGDLREGFSNPGPVLIGLCFGIYTFQYFALSNLFPTLLVDRLGLSIAAAGLISAGAVLANAAGNLAAGYLLRTGIPLWVILICGFVASGTFAFGIFNDAMPVAAVAILAAVSLAITGLIPASLFAAAPVVGTTPALLGITLGLTTQIGISGQLFGAAVLASFVERYDWSYAPVILVAVMIAGSAVAWLRGAVLRRRVTAP
jgi:predicted MFS family arabinose efflux permease